MKLSIVCFLISLMAGAHLHANEWQLCSNLFGSNNLIPIAVKELKQKPRTGWARKHIPNPETVWDHSLKVSQAANILFSRRAPDSKQYATRMGLYHDLAEAKVPDYTPNDKISSKEKHEQERAALHEILDTNNTQQRNILKAWEEYDLSTSQVAVLVKDLDKIDAAIQAMVYGRQGYKVDEFFPYTRNKIKDPELLEIYDRVYLSYLNGNLTDPYRYYFSLLRDGPFFFGRGLARS